MTEAEWLGSNGIEDLLNFVEEQDTASARKYRLFYVACCRRVASLMPDERSLRAVEMVEQLADDAVTDSECWDAMVHAQAAVASVERDASNSAAYSASLAAALDVMSLREAMIAAATARKRERRSSRGYGHEEESQCELLRDIVGNPFRTVTFSPSWRTVTALTLARQMYDSRDFSAMPILADALQDAGCDNEDILNHCRGSGPHVRGCWVVDLVLGKD